MSRTSRALVIVVLCFTLGGVDCASPLVARAAACRLVFPVAPERCYVPARLSSAERSVGFPIIDPTAIVSRLSRLRLTEIEVTESTRPFHGKQIHYLYGRIPGGRTYVQGPSPRFPRFIYVYENSGVEFRAHVGIVGYRGSEPWLFTAYLKRYNLSISVSSNSTRVQTLAVGRSLIKASVHGK